nr:unnamed protein product [Callosobruchus chinensis]
MTQTLLSTGTGPHQGGAKSGNQQKGKLVVPIPVHVNRFAVRSQHQQLERALGDLAGRVLASHAALRAGLLMSKSGLTGLPGGPELRRPAAALIGVAFAALFPSPRHAVKRICQLPEDGYLVPIPDISPDISPNISPDISPDITLKHVAIR